MSKTDLSEVADIVKQSALTVAGLGEQMGLVNAKLKTLSADNYQMKNEIVSIKDDFSQYKASQAQKERIEPEQRNEYEVAIKRRVAELLSPRNRFDLFGKFARKCWNDAKKHSYMLGRAGVDTKKMFHSDVIEYLSTWEPYSWGTDGYIKHLDDYKGDPI